LDHLAALSLLNLLASSLPLLLLALIATLSLLLLLATVPKESSGVATAVLRLKTLMSQLILDATSMASLLVVASTINSPLSIIVRLVSATTTYHLLYEIRAQSL
jgi:hypothetical protein